MRVLLLALLLALAFSGVARASNAQETWFQDDNQLIYAPPASVARTLDTLRSMGVDRLRVTLLWKAIAPAADQRTRPDFNANDPGAYPAGVWDKYDFVLQEARKRGMDVNFDITGPAPLWATRQAPREDIVDTYYPEPGEFLRFVAAVGVRYSGSYPVYGTPLPRVTNWAIWNEPNHSGWLTPQWEETAKNEWVERAPFVYRALADAAYTALVAAGHQDDVILIGETAPKGDRSKGIKRFIKARRFIRLLYCLDARQRPLKGAKAEAYGCRADGDMAKFRTDHPALFRATGFAHHPYDLLLAPETIPKDKDYITIGALGRLTHLLDRAFKLAGSKRRLPVWLTEYGYQTNPPDLLGVAWRQQSAYLDRSEYISYRNRRVKALAQFLLVDDAPLQNFQTGFVTVAGKRKPAYATFKLPVRVARETVRRGERLSVWGMLRTAAPDEAATARVQFKARRGKRWRTLQTKHVRQPRGYFTAKPRVRSSGTLRVAFRRANAKHTTYSRAVPIRVR